MAVKPEVSPIYVGNLSIYVFNTFDYGKIYSIGLIFFRQAASKPVSTLCFFSLTGATGEKIFNLRNLFCLAIRIN